MADGHRVHLAWTNQKKLCVNNYSRCTARWPLRHAVLPDYKLSQKRNIFAGKTYSTITCRMGWTWFDVNRSTFDDDIREKRILHFRSQWPWPLTFKPQICSLVTLVERCISTKLEFLRLPYFEKIGGTGRTDRQTEECNTQCGSNNKSQYIMALVVALP